MRWSKYELGYVRSLSHRSVVSDTLINEVLDAGGNADALLDFSMIETINRITRDASQIGLHVQPHDVDIQITKKEVPFCEITISGKWSPAVQLATFEGGPRAGETFNVNKVNEVILLSDEREEWKLSDLTSDSTYCSEAYMLDGWDETNRTWVYTWDQLLCQRG